MTSALSAVNEELDEIRNSQGMQSDLLRRQQLEMQRLSETLRSELSAQATNGKLQQEVASCVTEHVQHLHQKISELKEDLAVSAGRTDDEARRDGDDDPAAPPAWGVELPDKCREAALQAAADETRALRHELRENVGTILPRVTKALEHQAHQFGQAFEQHHMQMLEINDRVTSI